MHSSSTQEVPQVAWPSSSRDPMYPVSVGEHTQAHMCEPTHREGGKKERERREKKKSLNSALKNTKQGYLGFILD